MLTTKLATRLIPAALAVAATLGFATAPMAREGGLHRGQASFYDGDRFAGRPMANGDRFDPDSNSAAHRTLPLGTVAEVTNLRNGETRTVVIEDRGPYVGGRVIDVSPRIAQELQMVDEGVVPVEVRPVGQVPNRGRD
jgi:rare lipoprotein A